NGLGRGAVDQVGAELVAGRPEAVVAVPGGWGKVYNSAKHRAAAEGHGKIFANAEATAIAYSRALDSGGPGLVLRLKHLLFDRLVYRQLRARLRGTQAHPRRPPPPPPTPPPH